MQWVSILTFASRKVWKNTCKFGSGDGRRTTGPAFSRPSPWKLHHSIWPFRRPCVLDFGNTNSLHCSFLWKLRWYQKFWRGGCTSEFYFFGWCEQKRPEIIQKLQFSLLLNLEKTNLSSPIFLVLVAFLVYIYITCIICVCIYKITMWCSWNRTFVVVASGELLGFLRTHGHALQATA